MWHPPPNPSPQDFSHSKFKFVPGQPGGGVLVDPLPLLPDLVLHHDGGGPVGRRLLKALAAAGVGWAAEWERGVSEPLFRPKTAGAHPGARYTYVPSYTGTDGCLLGTCQLRKFELILIKFVWQGCFGPKLALDTTSALVWSGANSILSAGSAGRNCLLQKVSVIWYFERTLLITYFLPWSSYI